MYWLNHYSWTDDQEDVTTLRAVGLNSREIARLRHLRRVYRRGPDKHDQPQSLPDQEHLLFIRWLVMHGKLSDQMEGAHFSAQAESQRHSSSAFLVAQEQIAPSVHPMVQRMSWLRHKLRILHAVVAQGISKQP